MFLNMLFNCVESKVIVQALPESAIIFCAISKHSGCKTVK